MSSIACRCSNLHLKRLWNIQGRCKEHQQHRQQIRITRCYSPNEQRLSYLAAVLSSFMLKPQKAWTMKGSLELSSEKLVHTSSTDRTFRVALTNLAFNIGRSIRKEDAFNHVWGATIINDVSVLTHTDGPQNSLYT